LIRTERFAQVEIASLEDLRHWLPRNYIQNESVWLVRYEKGVPHKFVDRLAVIDEVLCFGWVDGLCRKLDGERTMQLISPRQQQVWARTFQQHVGSC